MSLLSSVTSRLSSVKARLGALWEHAEWLFTSLSYQHPSLYHYTPAKRMAPAAQVVRPSGYKLARKAAKGRIGMATIK